MSFGTFACKCLKGLTFEKKKEYRNRLELWLKVEKKPGAVRKDYY